MKMLIPWYMLISSDSYLQTVFPWQNKKDKKKKKKKKKKKQHYLFESREAKIILAVKVAMNIATSDQTAQTKFKIFKLLICLLFSKVVSECTYMFSQNYNCFPFTRMHTRPREIILSVMFVFSSDKEENVCPQPV